ncbi:MAG: hypothetical protein B6D77_07210 [gamma proteobacterium symbiont of Ctena orbiculata]|nr:MAG: hypothetical protein B6D77_07210 [gamma proteobacterium symbiont of Ctena orbiculata]PVV22698.1 MAG: hypothetical protein B6D79_12920 [gamma proteobacterium symbiont of Ctena orbiculata]
MTHQKAIQEGRQPKVAFVVFIPNDIAVEYTGNTVFENRSFRYSSKTDFTEVIEGKLAELLRDSGSVEFYKPDEQERSELLDNLSHERKYYWRHTRNLEEDKKMLSEWGKARGLDYIATINPGTVRLIPNRGPVIASKLLWANMRFVQFFMTLFDVENSQIDDVKYDHEIIIDAPTFRKQLTQKQLDKIKADWEFIVDREYPHGMGAPTLKSQIDEARIYRGDDYGDLTDSQIKEIDNWFVPHIEELIENMVVAIGFAEEQ